MNSITLGIGAFASIKTLTLTGHFAPIARATAAAPIAPCAPLRLANVPDVGMVDRRAVLVEPLAHAALDLPYALLVVLVCFSWCWKRNEISDKMEIKGKRNISNEQIRLHTPEIGACVILCKWRPISLSRPCGFDFTKNDENLTINETVNFQNWPKWAKEFC